MPRTGQHILGERPRRLYQDLPEDKTIRHGTLKQWQEQFSVGWEEL